MQRVVARKKSPVRRLALWRIEGSPRASSTGTREMTSLRRRKIHRTRLLGVFRGRFILPSIALFARDAYTRAR
jgi:hypothetical protein